jgi:hypothetical protein
MQNTWCRLPNIHTRVETYKYSIVTFGIAGLHCVVYSYDSECCSSSANCYPQDARPEFIFACGVSKKNFFLCTSQDVCLGHLGNKCVNQNSYNNYLRETKMLVFPLQVTRVVIWSTYVWDWYWYVGSWLYPGRTAAPSSVPTWWLWLGSTDSYLSSVWHTHRWDMAC